MDFWNLLQIEPTMDSREIKKAYAKLAKKYNPEEYPEEFLQLRKAYEQALASAERREQDQTAPIQAEGAGTDVNLEGETAGAAAPKQRFSFDIGAGDNTQEFDNCPAILKFRELYFEKKCKDRNVWLTYFTSPEYLEVAFEKGFARALRKAFAAETTIEKSFFSLLCLVYGLAKIPGRACEGSLGQPWLHFDGIEDIMAVVNLGKTPYRLKGLDQAIACGYGEYVSLRELAKSGQWNDHISFQFSALMDRYVSAYIYDTAPKNQGQYSGEYIPRHVSGLKLLNHFFTVTPLPRQAYEIVWNKLDLKNAAMGRNKVFYGGLREIALEKMPELEEEPKESFSAFRSDFVHFSQQIYKEEDREKIDLFFRREDLKRALCNQLFVESDVLRHWISNLKSAYFLERLMGFCAQEQGVVHRERICELAAKELRRRNVQTAWEEDEKSSADHGDISVENRAFFRYLMHVAFARAYSSERSVSLHRYLQENFPESLTWHRRMSRGDGKTSGSHNPPAFNVELSGKKLEITCHVRHLEYLFDEKPVFAPFIYIDSLSSLPDDTLFWVLLPVMFAHISEKPKVTEELARRLERLKFLQSMDIVLIADAIAGNVCKHFEEEYNPECLKLRRELNDTLYCCDIYLHDGAMLIYKSEPGIGDRVLREERLPQGDMDAALEMGRQLLDEYIEPVEMNHLRIKALPDMVAANVLYEPARRYEADEVTREVLIDMLQMISKDKLTRLELGWRFGEGGQSRYLIIIRDRDMYACHCFDDREMCRHTLVGYPEIYRTVQCGEIQFVPFHYGRLEDYNVHRSAASILRNIDPILQEVSNLSQDMEDPLDLWSRRRNADYHVDKCLLGGFPAADVFTNLYSKFIIRHFPSVIETKSLEGEVKTTPINNAIGRMYLQEQLQAFMRQRLSRLCLTYDLEKEAKENQRTPCQFQVHLLLLHDEGRYMMIYLNEEKKSMNYLVADVPAYKKLEGSKFKKTDFCGTKQREHLVHQDLCRIRAYLDMLLPSISQPERILGIFGEFSYGFNSVKAKTYEECKAEYLNM